MATPKEQLYISAVNDVIMLRYGPSMSSQTVVSVNVPPTPVPLLTLIKQFFVRIYNFLSGKR